MKKALSPVITTVLLILIVLILAVIIFLWSRTLIKDNLNKFGNPIEESCKSVNIQTSVTGNTVTISNIGNIPIFKFGFLEKGQPGEDISYVETSLITSDVAVYNPEITLSSGKKIEIIPVLLGESKDKEVQEHPCLNNKHVLTIP